MKFATVAPVVTALILCSSVWIAPLAVDAQVVPVGAKKPCLESGGVAINLNGNFGFCYLKGHRMRPGSVFAQCRDGKLSCYVDEGIPDKPRKEMLCIAPEPGFCGSSKDATPAPINVTTPTPTEPSHSTSGSSTSDDVDETEVGDEDVSGEDPVNGDAMGEEDEEEEEEEEADTESRGVQKKKVNPSALVAGNLPNGEVYDEEEDFDDSVAGDEDDANEGEEDDGFYRW